MKTKTLFLTSALLLSSLLSGCGGQNEPRASLGVSYIGADPSSLSVAIEDMADFNTYFAIPSGVQTSIEVTTPSGNKLTTTSLYYQFDEVGEYTFAFTFEGNNGAKESYTLTIKSLPPAPDVTPASNAISIKAGTTMSFADIYDRSGIIALPLAYTSVDFESVTYSDETISVDLYCVDEQTSKIEDGATSYTFDKPGTYTFNLNIHNESGYELTTINVTATDSDGANWGEGIVSKNAYTGDKANCVKLLASSSPSSLSYLGYEEELTLAKDTFYTVSTRFRGKNTPQIMLLADAVNGELSSGHGLICSLEQLAPYDGMRIFGPDRLRFSTPLAYRAGTFGRDDLSSKSIYDWNIVITKLSEAKLAIRSYLYEEKEEGKELVGFFDWMSVAYAHEMKGKSVFLGSSQFGNAIFEFEKPYLSDKAGNRATED